MLITLYYYYYHSLPYNIFKYIIVRALLIDIFEFYKVIL
jgi:hypothetical protein